MPENPSRDDGVTIACDVCGTEFVPVGRKRFCKPACRQAAWRERHPAPLPPLPSRAPRLATVYECPECAARYLGDQRCEPCGVFAVELGPVVHARIATNRLLLQICSNQPFRPCFRRFAKDPLSTGLVDRR
jgi:hypothetical protein